MTQRVQQRAISNCGVPFISEDLASSRQISIDTRYRDARASLVFQSFPRSF
jgi:hypothetical protein